MDSWNSYPKPDKNPKVKFNEGRFYVLHTSIMIDEKTVLWESAICGFLSKMRVL